MYEAARPPRWGRFSSKRTRKPASASATAEASPASPPPITITLFEDIRLGIPAEARAHQDAGFFGSADAHAFGENIIPARLDAAKQAAVNSGERPERCAGVFVDERDQADAFAVEIPGARGLVLQQRSQPGRNRPVRQRFAPDAELREVLGGQIDATHFVILRNVANNVRELEGDAE